MSNFLLNLETMNVQIPKFEGIGFHSLTLNLKKPFSSKVCLESTNLILLKAHSFRIST